MIHCFDTTQAVSKFPDLDDYSRFWPVDDLLKAFLKSSSSRWRREQRQKAANKALEKAEKAKAKKVKKANSTQKVQQPIITLH
jgi:hypothetical protein